MLTFCPPTLVEWVRSSVCPSVLPSDTLRWVAVDATPLTVFNRSFETLQVLLLWSGFGVILPLSQFFPLFNLIFCCCLFVCVCVCVCACACACVCVCVCSNQITIRIDTLWAQLLLEFSIDHFYTMHTCSTSSVDVHVVFGLSSFLFIIFFSSFSTWFLPAYSYISFRIDNSWTLLLLECSTDHFETTMYSYNFYTV